MSVTIKDVAALAGVSPSTVSRTCNNSPLISEKTQEKVRAAMKELGYEAPVQSAAAAEKPLDKKPEVIGIILPPQNDEEMENPFYLEVIRGISQYCNEQSCINTIVTGADENELLHAIGSMVHSHLVSSFILLYSTESDSVVEYLYDEEVPYVLIGKPLLHQNETVCVDNDNIAAGQDATQYLIDRGHTRIAYLGHSAALAYSAARRNGYRLALSDAGLPLQEGYCLELDLAKNGSSEKLRQLLQLPEGQRPTAILAADDMYALLLKQVCHELGLKIPDDLSVISFNNSIFSRMSTPRITSVDVSSLQLGTEAASQAIMRLNNPTLLPSKILVPYTLLLGDSVTEVKPAK